MEAGLGHESEKLTGSSIHRTDEQSHAIRVDPEGRLKVVTRDMWLQCLEKQREERPKPRQGEIHKVPDLLQASGKSKLHYQPLVVSLGPCHHGSKKLRQFQDLKSSMVRRFIMDEELEASLRSEIRKNIDKLKAAYSPEIVRTFEGSEWEEMLFLDGCFVLYFICCIMYHRVDDLKMKKYEIDSVHKDLFLLENQLPYQLLKIVSGNDPELLDLVCEYICTHKISNDPRRALKQEEEPFHLLDCLRTIIIGRRSSEPNNGLQPAGIRSTLLRQVTWGRWPLWSQLSTPPVRIKGSVLRHANELTAKGIHLKPNRSGFLKDISFNSHFIYGTLRLPKQIVDDSTRPLFLNLAAYEMCGSVDSVITSYICFLDSLVDHAEDIKELQSAGILVNHLPTDEDAAQLFNEMSEGLHPDQDAYIDVKRKIKRFFKHKTKASLASWTAEGYHNHFKSPLTAMAVLAAILALGLAATQTYFTIYPRGNK